MSQHASLVISHNLLVVNKRKYPDCEAAEQRAVAWLGDLDLPLDETVLVGTRSMPIRQMLEEAKPKVARTLQHFYRDVHAVYDLVFEYCEDDDSLRIQRVFN
eukprot:TRINITY_DN9738_c2_g1_i1.p2 TRINITY_DN9738_c2_g1~~TRINITY_DN9738_c2_g1_i1.p2  ORF type:complete len:102 (+),score=34.07 TRINITY_DN9738_c2_g1_i1:48-353(+)